MVVSYVPKKDRPANLLSFCHSTKKIDAVSGKTLIIGGYNEWKCRVDTFDQLVLHYSYKRHTKRRPMALVCNVIDLAAYNSLVIFNHVNLGAAGNI